ncbi:MULTISPECIES: LBP_cg2779 family protein [Levilactobacillus]|uniref:LBP_cg2779 family protein n=1 Tax=Levilactobacillus tongjiangensis TaxID=2486023 RepID=A0ABW1SNB6_9LACO|nr:MULTISPECIES: LBP_cg2779 family protein [Levilactobacillus]
MSQELNDLAEAIIAYQKKYDKTDGEMAFGSRISVEKFHAIKSGELQPTSDEQKSLKSFITAKPR